jgi:hypothetical protein
MNERIRELALLAGRPGYPRGESELQKFAELIVKACCDMVNKHHQYNNPNDCLLVLDIKEHFGVES